MDAQVFWIFMPRPSCWTAVSGEKEREAWWGEVTQLMSTKPEELKGPLSLPFASQNIVSWGHRKALNALFDWLSWGASFDCTLFHCFQIKLCPRVRFAVCKTWSIIMQLKFGRFVSWWNGANHCSFDQYLVAVSVFISFFPPSFFFVLAKDSFMSLCMRGTSCILHMSLSIDHWSIRQDVKLSLRS